MAPKKAKKLTTTSDREQESDDEDLSDQDGEAKGQSSEQMPALRSLKDDTDTKKVRTMLRRLELDECPKYVRTVGHRDYLSAQGFLREFERACFNRRVPKEDRAYHMTRFLDVPSQDWVMDNVSEDTMADWPQFKAVFLKKFEDKHANDHMHAAIIV